MAWSSFFKNSPQPPGAPPAQAPGNVPTKSTAPSSFYPTGGIYPETLAPDGLLAQLNADLVSVANSVTAAASSASAASASAALANTYANAAAVRYDIAQTLTSPQQAQARSNIGLAAVAASGSASDLTTGTLPAAQLPNPSATTLGGVKSKAAVTHQFVTAIGTDGSVTQAQPAATDVSGLAAVATSGSATDLTTGTLPAARLPTPTAATLGGVESYTAPAHQFINAISTAGVPSSAQPAAADVSGLGTAATLNVGVGPNNIVQLNGSSQLPAVDGSLLTGVTTTGSILYSASQSLTAAQQDQAQVNIGLGLGFRNRLINGDMRIDQRNSGAAFGTSVNGYTLDRWSVATTQTGKINGGQSYNSVTPPTGFTKYLGVQSQSAYTVLTGDFFAITQPIEGFHAADFLFGSASAKNLVLSFYVYSSLTGTFGGSLRNGAGTRSYPFTYTIGTASTWTRITVSIPGDTTGTWTTDNTSGLTVSLSLGAGATFSGTANTWATGNLLTATGATSVVATLNATFYVTGVQLEIGSTTATDFERRAYAHELRMCQRYYETGQFDCLGSGPGFVGNRIFFKVTKRATPTLAESGVSGGNVTLPATYDVIGVDGFRAFASATGTGTSANFDGAYTATAEL